MTGTFAIAAAALAAGGTSATAAGTLPTFGIAMTGNSISVPSTVPAGAVNVVSTVSGEATGSPTLVRLDPGVTFQQAFAAAQAAGGDPTSPPGVAPVGVYRPGQQGHEQCPDAPDTGQLGGAGYNQEQPHPVAACRLHGQRQLGAGEPAR